MEHTAMPGPGSDAARALVRSLDERIQARDREGAIQVTLEAVREGRMAIADLYTQVLGPLMVETGDRWQEGKTRVWEEHFTTQVVRDIVDAFIPEVMSGAAEAAPVGQRVVMACPPGEHHDLGLRMLADRFRLGGWQVFYLGTDTPVVEIVDAVKTLQANLLVLSASTHFNRVLLRDVAARLRSALPGVRLAVGGPAFTIDRQWPADELLDPSVLGLPGSQQTWNESPAEEARD